MKRETVLKVLNYKVGFFLLLCLTMSPLFPLWIMAISFVLFSTFVLLLITYPWGRKLEIEMNPPLLEIQILTTEEEEARKKARQKQWEQDRELEEEAHNLIVKMCENKKITLKFKRYRHMGPGDPMEIWAMEKAVPLTPDELYAITANRVLRVVTELHDDGIIYAHDFSRSGGWVSYELAEVSEQ